MPRPGASDELATHILLLPSHPTVPHDFAHGGSNGHSACVDALLAAAAPVNCRCCTGDTPLHVAARGRKARYAECVRLLLSHGADPTVTNLKGQTAEALAKGVVLQTFESLRPPPPPPPALPVYAVVELPDGGCACVSLGPELAAPFDDARVEEAPDSPPPAAGWTEAMEAFTGFSSMGRSPRARLQQSLST